MKGLSNMRVPAVIAVAAVALTVLQSCKKEPTGPDCNGNGTLRVSNTGTLPKRVIVDGVEYGTITAGESIDVTVVAGISHTLQFKYSNGNLACNNSTPSVAECETKNISCGS